MANIPNIGESINNSKFSWEHFPWKTFLNAPSSLTPFMFSHKIVPLCPSLKKKKKMKANDNGPFSNVVNWFKMDNQEFKMASQVLHQKTSYW